MEYEVEYVEIKNNEKPFIMTNYERLFREQMQNPEFVKACHEAKLERKLNEMLEDLKEKIDRNAPKKVLLETIAVTSIYFNVFFYNHYQDLTPIMTLKMLDLL